MKTLTISKRILLLIVLFSFFALDRSSAQLALSNSAFSNDNVDGKTKENIILKNAFGKLFENRERRNSMAKMKARQQIQQKSSVKRQFVEAKTTTAARSTGGSVQSKSSSEIKWQPVMLPAYGSIPDKGTYYYTNSKCQTRVVTITRQQFGLTLVVTPEVAFNTFSVIYSGEDAGDFVFSKYDIKSGPVRTGPMSFGYEVKALVGKPMLRLSKDWKRLKVLTDGIVYDIPITKTDYNRVKAAVDELFRQLSKSAGVKGGGNGGSGTKIDTDTDGQFPGNKHGYYTCPNCHGTGRCPHCGGDGVAGNSYLGGSAMECSPCNGRGRCASCNGAGKKYGVVH